MRNALRYAAINLAVVLGLLLVINTLLIGTYQGMQFWRSISAKETTSDPRARLPGYEEFDWAEHHFEELRNAGVEYHSFYGWRRKPLAGRTITIDEQGIRPTPGAAPKDSRVPMVVFLGGSTMWGEGADDHNTIAAHFVQQAGTALRAKNLGESAYNAFQGYLVLRIHVLHGLRPDLVITYDGINNVAGLCRAGNRPVGHGRELQMREAMRGLDQPRVSEALTARYFVLPIQEFAIRMRRRSADGWEDPYRLVCAADAERARAVATKLLDSWTTTMELAEGIGAQFVAVLQPSAYTGEPQTDHLSLDPAVKDEYDAVYGLVRAMLGQPPYLAVRQRVLDMTNALDDAGPVYIDSQHLAPRGNQIIAKRMLEAGLVAATLDAISTSSLAPDGSGDNP